MRLGKLSILTALATVVLPCSLAIRKSTILLAATSTADYDSAVWRARNVAAPKRAQQMNHNTPCAMKAGKCYDCKSPERICRGMVTLWGPMAGTQVEVLLVDEDLGL